MPTLRLSKWPRRTDGGGGGARVSRAGVNNFLTVRIRSYSNRVGRFEFGAENRRFSPSPPCHGGTAVVRCWGGGNMRNLTPNTYRATRRARSRDVVFLVAPANAGNLRVIVHRM